MLIIKVQNITDLAPVSDYHYEVLINLEVIASGEVKGHVRADGWAELVRRVIELYLVKPTMLERFDEMVYALDAGNLDREDIPAAVFRRWIEYVQEGVGIEYYRKTTTINDDVLFCSVCGTPIGTDCAVAQSLDLSAPPEQVCALCGKGILVNGICTHCGI